MWSGVPPSDLGAMEETQQRPQWQRCARGAAQGEVMVTPAQARGEHWGHPACKCSDAWTRGVVGSGRP